MKDSVKLFIDQRGLDLRALITEGDQILATAVLPGPLGSGSLQELVAALVASSGRKPEHAHLLISNEQVKFSTYRLQEMPLADIEKIVQRSMTTATSEKEPIFRLTPLAPQQDKDVYLAEQIPREALDRLRQLFTDARLPLTFVSTGLQANLAAFAPQRENIIQAQAIFDISQDAVAAIFISPTDILHQEIQLIPETEQGTGDADDAGRGLKRRLFAILNVIHGLYSQYMLTNPLAPVEKVWLCGPGAEIAGLDASLVDAMDVEVAAFDLLAGRVEASRSFTPLAGLVGAKNPVNFISAAPGKSLPLNSKTFMQVAGSLVALLCLVVVGSSFLTVSRLKKQLATTQSELQPLQVAAIADQGRAASLRFLQKLDQTAPPLQAIFKEIADRLPREIQLDGINLRQSDEAGTLEVLAVTRHKTPWENERIFTALMTALDGVDNLECKQNPDIAMLRVGEEKMIKIKVTCQTTSVKGGSVQ